MMSAEEQGDNCIGCEECLELCPQDIAIPEWLEKAHGWLGPKK
jgi:predicted aldo/keto reductase-like oxidoreductase